MMSEEQINSLERNEFAICDVFMFTKTRSTFHHGHNSVEKHLLNLIMNLCFIYLYSASEQYSLF